MGANLTPAALATRWQAATVNFNTLFQQALLSVKPMWEKVAMKISSDTREEDFVWLDRLPQMREWLGPRQVNSLSARMQTLVNRKYEDTLSLKRTDLEDDKIGVYGPRVQMLAEQAGLLPDKLVADALTGGTSAVVYDNQNYFDASHPVNPDDPSVTGPAGSATQANLLTGHGLNSDNLADAIQQMSAWVGSDGQPLEIVPNLMVVPPQLRFTARRLLQMETIGQDVLLSGPAHGAAGVSNVLQGSLDLMVWPRLGADATSWYVLCTTGAIKPLIFQERIPPEFAYLTKPDDYNVFMNDEFLYGTRSRGVAGYGPWFLALKCTA